MRGRKKGLGKRIAAYLLTLAMVFSMVGFQAGTVRADGIDEGNGTSVVDGGSSENGGSTSSTEVSGTETSTAGTEVSGTETSTAGTEVSGTEITSGTEVSGTETSTDGTEVSGTEGDDISGGEDGEGDELSEGNEANLLSDDEDETESGTSTETESWDYRYNRYEVYQLRQSQLNAALEDVPEGYKWVYVCLVEQGERHYDLDDVVCSTEAHTHNSDCYTSELTCGNTVHTHTEACYGRKLVCEQGVHVHDESCYGLVNICGKHDHEEAGETYKECKLDEHTHTDDCYEEKWYGKKLTCKLKEHTHKDGVCQGYLTTRKVLDCLWPGWGILHTHDDDCYKLEYVFCTKENHTHTDKCYTTQLTCTLHVHDDVACYDDHALLCGNEEHTHTADCYTDKLTCEKAEHQHSVEEGCYRWVEGEEALYNCMLVNEEDDGMAELGQGNEAFSYTLTVTCKDGLPAVGSKVTVTLKDYNPFAKYPILSRDLYTGIDGKIQLDYSGTYDRIISVTVDGQEILNGEIKVGYLQNRYYDDDYQFEEHEFVEVEGSAVAPTINEEGKTADQKCKHCGVEIKGEAIEKLTSYKVSYYMLKPGIALPDGTVSNPTKNWDYIDSILVEKDPEGSTTDKSIIEDVLGSSEEILKPFEKTFEYNGTVYTYAKAEVFRIMKENDYDTVGYHADCRMIRGYSEGETVPYAENDIFVLYVDEDGTFIDKGYISAQDGVITVDKSLDETYNKVKHGKNYIFSNWIDEDGNTVEVNGTVSIGDKDVIVLTANYVEKPLARFFLLYKDKNEEVPSENVGDATTKYTNRVVTGALTKGVVTYETNGVLAIPEEGYTTVEDYIKAGPTEDEINLLLSDAGYSAEDIERYGLTIDWFRTMSYDNEEFYHVDGKVVNTAENVKVSVYKKDTAGTEEFVGSFWVGMKDSISEENVLGRYTQLKPAVGYTLSWEDKDGNEYVFGTSLESDTDVYAVYTVEEKEEEEIPDDDGTGETTGGGGNGGNGGNGGGGSVPGGDPNGGSTPDGDVNDGDNSGDDITVIPDEDTPLSPEPDDGDNDAMDVTDDSDSSDEELADIGEDDVPLSDGSDITGNDETITIEDEATPLSDNPLTGDSAPIAWAALAVLAAFGLTASFVTGKRKKED